MNEEFDRDCRQGLRWFAYLVLFVLTILIAIPYIWMWTHSYWRLCWVDDTGKYDGNSCNFKLDGPNVGAMRFYLHDFDHEGSYGLLVVLDLDKADMQTKFMDVVLEVRGENIPMNLIGEGFKGVHRQYEFTPLSALKPLSVGDVLNMSIRIKITDIQNSYSAEIRGQAHLVAEWVLIVAWPT